MKAMNLPHSGDYIDIHTHESSPVAGIFAIENMMAHESRVPDDMPDQNCTYGIHPWHLDPREADNMIDRVRQVSPAGNLVAIGEAGYDRLRGPSPEVQARVFEAQVEISEQIGKPLYIHCVKAWEELLHSHSRMKPRLPWLVHGFRGSIEMAAQLFSRGMYLSFWFSYVMRPESAHLLRSVPTDRIFLESDGADTDIRILYRKAAADLGIQTEELRLMILGNYRQFFNHGK